MPLEKSPEDLAEEIDNLRDAVRALIIYVAGGSKTVYRSLDRLVRPGTSNREDQILKSLTRAGGESLSGLAKNVGYLLGMAERLDHLDRSYQELIELIAPPMEADLLGLDREDLPFTRIMSLDLYADTHLPESFVDMRVRWALSAQGFETIVEESASRGSIRKKWWARSVSPMTRAQFREAMELLGRAAELHQLDFVQSQVDEKNALTMKHLLDAVKDAPNAAMRDGAVLIVKRTGDDGRCSIAGITLTQRQLLALHRNPDLLDRPADILRELKQIDPGTADAHDVGGLNISGGSDRR